VFPVPTGMNRSISPEQDTSPCVPRAHGDEPLQHG